ncbi:cbb3-type cytochrome c oxidase subunit 3 [bacterium]|nr:cbb3-type cytochrome c oxidase subunit 3 [bacterium]MBU1984398.1 cbb3-type cytochrome c oxidase subunit 3 [bacterium]
MIKDVITNLGEAIGPLIGLVLFFVVFIGVIVWTYRGRKDRFDYPSRLPLDNGDGMDIHTEHAVGLSEPEGTRS